MEDPNSAAEVEDKVTSEVEAVEEATEEDSTEDTTEEVIIAALEEVLEEELDHTYHRHTSVNQIISKARTKTNTDTALLDLIT